MKKNLKNIVIQDPLESYPIKSKSIIQTTIINSPKIISSKNHVIIRQYIHTNEPEQKFNGNYTDKRRMKTGSILNNFKEMFNDKTKLIYHKQGLNSNFIKNDNSLLNNTITIFNRNQNSFNNHIKNSNNKTNYRINNIILKKTEINNKKHKINIESYKYLFQKQKIKTFDNNDNNVEKFNQIFKKTSKLEKNVKISKNAQLFSNEEIDNNKIKTLNRNLNANILNYEIEREKSNTLDNLAKKKFKKKFNNNEENSNKNYSKGLKTNVSELSLYIKKPYQKQLIKNASQNRDCTSQNSYLNVFKGLNNLTIDNKNKFEEQNHKPIKINKKDKFKKNNELYSIKEKNNNQMCKKIILLDKKKDENKLLPKYSKKKRSEIGDNLSSPLLDEELNEKSENYMSNKDYTIYSCQNLIKNNSLPKTSFRFLVSRASKDKQFGDSFHKAYEINKNNSIGKSLERIRNRNDKLENELKEKSISSRINENENDLSTLSKNPTNSNLKKLFKDKRNSDNLLMNNLKVVKNKTNENEFKDNIQIKAYYDRKNEKKQINEMNKFSKTLNNFKISPKNDENKDIFSNILKNKSNDNIFIGTKNKTDIIDEIIVENEERKDFVIVSSIEPQKQLSSFIDIELLYNFENKILPLIYKIKKSQKYQEEIYDIINYYFKNDISKHIIQLFNGVYYKNIMISYNKTELLSYFLCYDICFYNCFEQIILFINSIINLIHNNFLLLLTFIINGNKNNDIVLLNNNMNKTIIYYLENIIKQNINMEINNDEINEKSIIKMIMRNVVEINKYYKLIIDNAYQRNYLNNNEIDNNLKFPYCLRYINNNNNNKEKEELISKKQLIISSFFIESYQLLNNYSIFDLENFFYSFLDKKNIKIYELNNQLILPKIDSKKYKYTLVLDLDETLVHCDKNSSNKFILKLRPGLIDFLQKMKKIFELILFSFGTTNYVESIIKVIEKNEKFFEYILDRNHGIYDNGDCIKNLNVLNRDLKNVIMIDDTSNYFKLHKDNGICVKPFFGDAQNDNNTLLVLGNILEKIFYDANISGDIRISLKKYKKFMELSNIINNNN